MIAEEIDSFLRTGDYDPHCAAWPGEGFMERTERGRRDLLQALCEQVRLG